MPNMSRNNSTSSLFQNSTLLIRVDNNHAGQRTVQKKKSPREQTKKIKLPISSRSEFKRWDDLGSEENSNSSITSLSEQDGASISRSDEVNELHDGFKQYGFHWKSTQYSQEEKLLMKEIEIKVQNERKGLINNGHHYGEKMRQNGNNIQLTKDHMNQSNVSQWTQFHNNPIDSNEQITARKPEIHDFSRNAGIDYDSRNFDPNIFSNRKPGYSWDTSNQFCNRWNEQHTPPWLNHQQPLQLVQQKYQFVQKNMTVNRYYVKAQQPTSNCHGNNNTWQLPGHDFMIAGQPNSMQPNLGTTEHRIMVTGQQKNITQVIGRPEHDFVVAGQPNNITPHMGASGHNFMITGQSSDIMPSLVTPEDRFMIKEQQNDISLDVGTSEHRFTIMQQQRDITQGVGTSEHRLMVTPEIENPLPGEIQSHESEGRKRKNDQHSKVQLSAKVKKGRYINRSDMDLESTKMKERGFITDCTPSHPLCKTNSQNEWNQSYETHEDKSDVEMQHRQVPKTQPHKPCQENNDVGNKENCVPLMHNNSFQIKECKMTAEKVEIEKKELPASIGQAGHQDAGGLLKQDQRVCANDLDVCNGLKLKTFQGPEKRVIDVVKGKYVDHFNQANPKRALQIRESATFSNSTSNIEKLETFGQYSRLDTNIDKRESFASKKEQFDRNCESGSTQLNNGLVKDASKFTDWQSKNESKQGRFMPERLPKWKVAALSDHRCPVSGCLSTTYIKDLRKHAFKAHFPAALKRVVKGEFQPFDHAVIFEVLKLVACVILKGNPSLDGLVRYFNTRKNQLPAINITDETDEMRSFCIRRGWPVPATFTISPMNSMAVLIHWRVLLLCIGFMNKRERMDFKKFVPKPGSLAEQTNKGFVPEIKQVKGNQSNTPACVDVFKPAHITNTSKEKPRESNDKDKQLVVTAQSEGSLKTKHVHTKSLAEGKTHNLEKMKDGKTIIRKTNIDEENASEMIKNTLSNKKARQNMLRMSGVNYDKLDEVNKLLLGISSQEIEKQTDLDSHGDSKDTTTVSLSYSVELSEICHVQEKIENIDRDNSKTENKLRQTDEVFHAKHVNVENISDKNDGTSSCVGTPHKDPLILFVCPCGMIDTDHDTVFDHFIEHGGPGVIDVVDVDKDKISFEGRLPQIEPNSDDDEVRLGDHEKKLEIGGSETLDGECTAATLKASDLSGLVVDKRNSIIISESVPRKKSPVKLPTENVPDKTVKTKPICFNVKYAKAKPRLVLVALNEAFDKDESEEELNQENDKDDKNNKDQDLQKRPRNISGHIKSIANDGSTDPVSRTALSPIRFFNKKSQCPKFHNNYSKRNTNVKHNLNDSGNQIVWEDGKSCPVKGCAGQFVQFPNFTKFDNHWKFFHVPVHINKKCEVCGEESKRKYNMRQHVEEEHGGTANLFTKSTPNMFYFDPGPTKKYITHREWMH